MALYAGRDVVACTPTGARKTFSFWIPLLMAIEDGHVDKNYYSAQPAWKAKCQFPMISVYCDSCVERVAIK